MTTRLHHFDYNALNLSSSENIGLPGDNYVRKNGKEYEGWNSIARSFNTMKSTGCSCWLKLTGHDGITGTRNQWWENPAMSLYIYISGNVILNILGYEVTGRCKNAITRGFPCCLITSLVLIDPRRAWVSGLAGSEVWLSSILHIVIRDRERDRWEMLDHFFFNFWFYYSELSCRLPLKCLYSPPSTSVTQKTDGNAHHHSV